MKAKRILTLLIALMIGVMVNAQGIVQDSQEYQDKLKQDNYLKIMWLLEYGTNPMYLFDWLFLTEKPPAPVKETPPHRVVGNADSSPFVSNTRVQSRVPHFKDEYAVKSYSSNRPGNRY